MKKIILFAFVFILFGCNQKGEVNVIEVGNFSNERNAMHEKRNYDVCDENPERCYKGVPW